VRVNTNLWTCAEARKYFKSKGFESSDPIRNQYGELPLFISSQRVTPAGKGSRRMNTYQTFLVFNPRTRFHEEEAYQSGKIILQDKASCFPATVLAQDIHEPHGDFIDATAAPGNKTTHLSALLGNKGKVSAFVNP
jgi:putative methyltransferase